jgi:hypothetical protein
MIRSIYIIYILSDLLKGLQAQGGVFYMQAQRWFDASSSMKKQKGLKFPKACRDI